MNTFKLRIHQIIPNTHFVTNAGISTAHHHQKSRIQVHTILCSYADVGNNLPNKTNILTFGAMRTSNFTITKV